MVNAGKHFSLARELCHLACQWPSRAARANLPAEPDDSHSSLRWRDDRAGIPGGLFSLPLNAAATGEAGAPGAALRVGFLFAPARLVLLDGETLCADLRLENASDAEAGRWLDERLQAAGLQPASGVAMPYELEHRADFTAFAGLNDAQAALGNAYGRTAAALEHLVQTFGHRARVTPAVRCWPHHFDLAAFFALEAGDPETARAIGVGFSPGDETLAHPYFYCTPWPVPEPLPAEPAPAPFHWHQTGFTSLITTAAGLLEDSAALATALEAATLYAHQTLAAH